MYKITKQDEQLLAAIQDGLPLVSNPYAVIGEQVGISELEVIENIEKLKKSDIIKRMGVIVHHHPLGYNANAMVVWNLPDDQLDNFGSTVSKLNFVTLCYQRTPDPEKWPYNLYTMIHGHDRDYVLEKIESLSEIAPNVEYQVLFSKKRFKQQGAKYFATK